MRRCVLVDEMMNITFVSGVGMGWGGEGGARKVKVTRWRVGTGLVG